MFMGIFDNPQTINKTANTDLLGAQRFWRSMDGLHNIGRFIPDSKPRSEEERRKAEETRKMTRGEKIVDTEVHQQ
jgi:hypothetical protein